MVGHSLLLAVYAGLKASGNVPLANIVQGAGTNNEIDYEAKRDYVGDVGKRKCGVSNHAYAALNHHGLEGIKPTLINIPKDSVLIVGKPKQTQGGQLARPVDSRNKSARDLNGMMLKSHQKNDTDTAKQG